MERGGGGGGGGGAPTGCYKCGRPGHWSRDCPSNPNPISNSNSNLFSSSSNPKSNSAPFKTAGGGASKEKPKKVPRSRPKLTPELLLSDDGIGYILRHFPRAFKYRGRGREVSDLGNLLRMYAEWHSHLIPYYPFDQFVHKVEQVGATRRVKTCLGGLRERVANGGDLTKLRESTSKDNISNFNQEAMDIEEPCVQEDAPMKRHDTDDLQQVMLEEIYKQATEEPSPELCSDVMATDTSCNHVYKDLPNQDNEAPNGILRVPSETQISEEQKARMEANRLKALERAAARARLL